VQTWNQPRYQTTVWSQPTYYSAPTYYSSPTMTFAPSYGQPMQSVVVTSPFQQSQPTLQFAPPGDFEQRLLSYPPSSTRRYAGRRTFSTYR
jgi:hypothetical protein